MLVLPVMHVPEPGGAPGETPARASIPPSRRSAPPSSASSKAPRAQPFSTTKPGTRPIRPSGPVRRSGSRPIRPTGSTWSGPRSRPERSMSTVRSWNAPDPHSFTSSVQFTSFIIPHHIMDKHNMTSYQASCRIKRYQRSRCLLTHQTIYRSRSFCSMISG